MSVRITRKAKRVLDHLSRGASPASEIRNETNINFATLWPILDRLIDEGLVTVEGRLYSLTSRGRTARREAEEAVETARQAPPQVPGPRPRPRRPYGQWQTPWPRGEGRHR